MQNRAKTVNDAIIEPMTRLFQPPSHLRSDREAYLAAIEEYETQLAPFTKGVLQKAWEDVKESHETWIWPHVRVIKEACRRHTPPAQQSEVSAGKMPWVAKDEHAQALTNEFMAKFSTSPLMRAAHAESWDGQLRRYAYDAANAQARTIAGCTHRGYSNAVYQWGAPSQAEVKQRARAFEAACRQQASAGFIAVEVPSEAIEAWKAGGR